MQKTTAKSKRAMDRTKNIWWISLGLVVLIIAVLIIANQIAIHNDHIRFTDVAQKKSAIAASLSDYLGDNVASTKEQDECFNTEQGPYDNGRLWCQVATIVSLENEVSFGSLGGYLSQSAAKNGIGVETSGDGITARYWFSFQGMTCTLSSVDAQGKEVGTATADVLNDGVRPAFAITCADRAKASYYPLVR